MGDEAIQATNDDAASCKRFAIQQGYWRDPYLQFLVKAAERKAPEINRGYYVRTHGIKYLLEDFIKKTESNCQIISLGAGFDTLFWRLKDEGLLPKTYVELDFRAVTSRKCYYIKSRSQLLDPLMESCDGVKNKISIENAELHSPRYHIMTADLRDVADVESKLTEAGIDKNLPTVFISECVLVYMTVQKSSDLLKWIGDSFPTVLYINYEQVNMADRFGQVMQQNLRSRHCELHGVDACASMDTQKNRFLSVGWEGADAMDMMCVYHKLPPADIHRIERLEFLDELELLQQLFQHYCICWAYKDKANIGLSSIGFA
ncbi:leucine carboxyl methyltransferase 1-like [Saccoglossus kowalevskii]|uniref:Leucine carboxyl methyltransferase 1 n=1 Tax=Saccoglossus kowalevskii TaxID=10224 RepID=A0ABM0MP84_SACKO|nr:PREDICTED: leucine carboxyl methyltransferase 1-like [Saccoglossus kowalevskii]